MEYGLAILEAFSSERPSLGIADLAQMIGMSRSTTHRYVTTLTVLGYLEQGARRKYRLAPRAAGPGMAALGVRRLAAPARAHLQELREQTGHTVGVGVLDDKRALYVDRLPGHRAGQLEVDEGLGIGVPVPLHCTALGKALLAGLPDTDRLNLLAALALRRYGPNSMTAKHKLGEELDRVRREGLALSDEELRSGSRSIATLLHDPRLGRTLAIDLTAPCSACSAQELLAEIGPQLKRAAELAASA